MKAGGVFSLGGEHHTSNARALLGSVCGCGRVAAHDMVGHDSRGVHGGARESSGQRGLLCRLASSLHRYGPHCALLRICRFSHPCPKGLRCPRQSVLHRRMWTHEATLYGRPMHCIPVLPPLQVCRIAACLSKGQ